MIRYVLSCTLLMGLMMPITGFAADNLCPDTASRKELAVNDMADVQFDIDRLGLCLQRARLLQQIDETVKKREQIRQQPLVATGNVFNTGLGGLPSMPAIPPLSADKIAAALPGGNAMPKMAAPVPLGEWKIQRIWGQGNTMQAQLVRDDVIANVKVGDILPSGERIAELSVRGVMMEHGKTRTSLGWLETTKKDSAGQSDSDT